MYRNIIQFFLLPCKMKSSTVRLQQWDAKGVKCYLTILTSAYLNFNKALKAPVASLLWMLTSAAASSKCLVIMQITSIKVFFINFVGLSVLWPSKYLPVSFLTLLHPAIRNKISALQNSILDMLVAIKVVNKNGNLGTLPTKLLLWHLYIFLISINLKNYYWEANIRPFHSPTKLHDNKKLNQILVRQCLWKN